ncbi:hypothetical protein [Winogradskyella algicola]|uniref:hypothetical protein n=1 Tax=Winogradskyella algicola TaxID=2575815 RepID=UPI001108A7BF|nr:hypothetical protein [Winogradskyella algicola]
MKNPVHILILILLLAFVSCSKEYKIDKSDYSLIPYNGNEILVLKSTENKLDTIFINGIERYFASSDPLAFFPDQHEIQNLNCKISDPNYNRYLPGKVLIELRASSDGTQIWFDIIMKESWYYGKKIYSKTEFDSVPITKMIIDDKVYNDVKIFESDGSYEQRDNYAERFYWSLSQGFLGLSKRNEKWRLIKKYVP